MGYRLLIVLATVVLPDNGSLQLLYVSVLVVAYMLGLFVIVPWRSRRDSAFDMILKILSLHMIGLLGIFFIEEPIRPADYPIAITFVAVLLLLEFLVVIPALSINVLNLVRPAREDLTMSQFGPRMTWRNSIKSVGDSQGCQAIVPQEAQTSTYDPAAPPQFSCEMPARGGAFFDDIIRCELPHVLGVLWAYASADCPAEEAAHTNRALQVIPRQSHHLPPLSDQRHTHISLECIDFLCLVAVPSAATDADADAGGTCVRRLSYGVLKALYSGHTEGRSIVHEPCGGDTAETESGPRQEHNGDDQGQRPHDDHQQVDAGGADGGDRERAVIIACLPAPLLAFLSDRRIKVH